MTSGYEIALGIQGAIAEIHRVRERELETELHQLRAKNEQLRKAAIELRDDMIERAKRKSHLNSGEGFVEAGATVWANFCNVLAERK